MTDYILTTEEMMSDNIEKDKIRRSEMFRILNILNKGVYGFIIESPFIVTQQEPFKFVITQDSINSITWGA